MKIKFLTIFCIFFINLKSNQDIKEWSILTYIQANNDLAHLACYSISHMQAGVQSVNGVNVLVHWDENGLDKISRYKIIPGDMEFISSYQKKEDHNHIKDLVDSMKWVQTNFPAKNYALILWDHGSGIIDYERYDEVLFERKFFNKAILYDDTYKQLFTNQDLFEALNQIKDNLGKKIDIVIMDACFMAMFEIGYQIRNCVKYLIASQEAESAEGLPYGTFLYSLTHRFGKLTSLELAKCIVNLYGKFYLYKEGFQDYTFSAVNLDLYDEIKEKIDSFLNWINICKKINTKLVKTLITDSRIQSHEYYWNDYIDLYSFLESFKKQINKIIKKQLIGLNEFLNLKNAIINCMNLIKKAVEANVFGHLHYGSNGISIYYPNEGIIHESYYKTFFALESKWTDLLEEQLNS